MKWKEGKGYHEDGIAREDGVADDVGDTVRGVAGSVDHFRFEITDFEGLNEIY